MPLTKTLDNLTEKLEFAAYRPRILIVDDQVINIQALHQIFASDHEVFMATSGQSALDFCRKTPPDLILLDVIMPGMDGLEVCAQLKQEELTADIPVLFVTAQNDANEESRALMAGGMDFISKPVNPDVVRARVHTHVTLKLQRDLLKKLVFTDPLTGLANRRNFDQAIAREWRHCQRNGKSLAVLMIDIDCFKQYNDTYGHQQGDTCLQAVAACLQAGFRRPHDIVARYGGEEFICLMPECELQSAISKAASVLRTITDQAIPHSSTKVSDSDIVTLSIGVAATVPGNQLSIDELIAKADQKLYEAKQAGRNRVGA
ncbi:diguanylate cyclase [Undibacterium sp. TC4M20W]|uniref:diguanylate cyclase n=1 Tax=Undibacterium sp. TC4M20W TaxID=3413052 RepID=UPI003BF1B70E